MTAVGSPDRQSKRYARMMRSWRRRVRANLRYIRAPFFDFLPFLLITVAFVFLGGLSFHLLYHEPLSYGEALYCTYSLIFMEHLYDFPQHWLLQMWYFVLPLVGLVVVLDGFVRFGYHILRRNESGPEWMRAMAQTFNDHVILFGLGKVGFRVLQQLIRLGEPVVIVEKDPACENLSFARRHGIPVRVGSGREEGILLDLNIEKAKSVILCTDDDLANLELAIDARIAKPGIRVVLRLYDQELAQKIKESLDIHLAFSTSELSAPLFATASSDRTIVNSFYVHDRLFVVADVKVEKGSGLNGKTIGVLGREFGTHIVSIKRGETPDFQPDAASMLAEGDELTVQCEPETLTRLHALNGRKSL